MKNHQFWAVFSPFLPSVTQSLPQIQVAIIIESNQLLQHSHQIIKMLVVLKNSE